MVNKVKEYIKSNNLIKSGDKVLVALSGGPDSVCLLHILYKLKEELQIQIGTVHINHMLRGEEAIQDELYVKEISDNLGIECFIERIDIAKIAKERSISLELAGREERYKVFEQICNEKGFNKIAVAHNANDQAETILMRMMRGTGLEGLCGIRNKRGNRIIRPILCLIRTEIESYCETNNLNPKIDKSNLERVYSRNRVRLDLLTYMKEHFNPDIIQTLNRMGTLLEKDNKFLDNYSEDIFNKYVEVNNEIIKLHKDLFEIDDAILTRVIKKSIVKITKDNKDFEMTHIYDIISLAKIETGKIKTLPRGLIAENIYGDIVIRENKVISSNEEDVVFVKKSELSGASFEFMGYLINIDNIINKNSIEFSNNVLIKYFDYDNIKEGVIFRKRKTGDKIKPLGMKGNKKIKDLFMDLKIPREQRDRIPIVSFDDEIAWVVGYKVSETFKVKSTTKHILKIMVSRKD